MGGGVGGLGGGGGGVADEIGTLIGADGLGGGGLEAGLPTIFFAWFWFGLLLFVNTTLLSMLSNFIDFFFVS